jgi:hypothetical protein
MAIMPREARCRLCGSNWVGEPPVQPPPKKNTMAGRGLVDFCAGSKIQTLSSVSPILRYVSDFVPSMTGG